MSVLGALAAGLGANAVNIRELGRRRPMLRNAKRANRALDEAFDKRVDQLKPGKQESYGVYWNKPDTESNAFNHYVNHVRKNQNLYGAVTPITNPNNAINIKNSISLLYPDHS